jgi:hypothetical protein
MKIFPLTIYVLLFFSLKPFIQILPSDSKKACGNLALRPLKRSFKITAESDLWESRSTFTLVTILLYILHLIGRSSSKMPVHAMHALDLDLMV